MPNAGPMGQSQSAGRLVEGLARPAVDAILAVALKARFRAGQVIFRSGEPARRLFLLQKGAVKISRVTSGGQEIVLSSLAPNAVFGLGTLLQVPINYIATAESLEDCETLFWKRETVQRLAQTYPRISENTIRIALHFVLRLLERHADLLSSTAEQRLAQAVTRLGLRSGHPTTTGVEVGIKNEHLASLADISPFTASRLLQKWERQGALKKSRGKLLIRCPEKLLN